MRTITINPLSMDSIQEAIDLIHSLQKGLDQKCEELVRKLTEKGYEVVSYEYSQAEYAGPYDLEVIQPEVHKEGDSYVGIVRAQGMSLLFVEFGTGILSSSAPAEEYAIIDTPIAAHGTFGKGYGSRKGGWAYEGVRGERAPSDTKDISKKPGWVHTYGNDATPGMYRGREAIIKDFEQIAREVFAYD